MNPWETDYGLTPEQQKELDMLLILDENNRKKAQQEMTRQQDATSALQAEAEATGPITAYRIGMGREYKKLGSGTWDLADTALEAMGSDSAAARRKTRAEEWKEEDRLYAPMAEAHPVATTLGPITPYLATLPFEAIGAVRTAAAAPTWISNLARPLFGRSNFISNWLGGVARDAVNAGKVAAREGAIGGVQGALHYDDTFLNGAGWGAGGGLAGMYLGRVLGSGANRLNPELQRIVNFGTDNGIFLPPGMRTGNSRLQQLDRAMQTYPLTADKFNDMLQRSKEAENRLISRELGGPQADIFSADYLADQRLRIKRELDRLALNTAPGQFTPHHYFQVADIVDRFRDTDPSGIAPNILTRYEQLVSDMASNNVPMTGQNYEAFTRKLNRAADKQFSGINGDRYLGNALNEISDIFNDVIGSGMGGASSAEWRNARRQFALLKAIEKNKDIAGYVDVANLAKDFKASPVIRDLGEIEAWRRKQPPNSLSTSGMLARMLSSAAHNPAQAVGMASLLLPRMTKGVLGLDSFFSGAYLAGYPHVTGFLPWAGRYTYDATERGIPRMLAADPNEP